MSYLLEASTLLHFLQELCDISLFDLTLLFSPPVLFLKGNMMIHGRIFKDTIFSDKHVSQAQSDAEKVQLITFLGLDLVFNLFGGQL